MAPQTKNIDRRQSSWLNLLDRTFSYPFLVWTCHFNIQAELLGDVALTTVPKSNHLTDIAWSEISVQQDLGQGNFGTVSLGVWKGVQVALKRCKDPNNNEFIQEAQLMMYVLSSDNLIFFY